MHIRPRSSASSSVMPSARVWLATRSCSAPVPRRWHACAGAGPRPVASSWLPEPGNNGGDGLVLARLAAASGMDASVLLVGEVAAIHGEAAEALRDLRAAGLDPRPFDAARLNGCDVVVDALLGIGVRAPLKAEWRAAIETMNACDAKVFSIDLPSGLDPDTGGALPAVKAAATITFLGLKQGLFLGEGPAHAGEIEFDALDVAPAVIRRAVAETAGYAVPARRAATTATPGTQGPVRPRAGHRRRTGHGRRRAHGRRGGAARGCWARYRGQPARTPGRGCRRSTGADVPRGAEGRRSGGGAGTGRGHRDRPRAGSLLRGRRNCCSSCWRIRAPANAWCWTRMR